MVTSNHNLEISGGATVVVGTVSLYAKLLVTMQILGLAITISVGLLTLIGIYRKWRKGEW